MASKAQIQDRIQHWEAWCETVRRSSPVRTGESATQRRDRMRRLLRDAEAFRRECFPHYCPSPSPAFDLKRNRVIVRNSVLDAVCISYQLYWCLSDAKLCFPGARFVTNRLLIKKIEQIEYWCLSDIFGDAQLCSFVNL